MFDVEDLAVERVGYASPGPVAAGQDEACRLLIRHGLDRGQGLVVLGRDDHRHAGLDDSGLLASNQIEGVAEQCGVLVADRCDHADGRCDDVRGVQPAAEPHLQHHPVDLLLGKVQQRQHGDDLERGDSQARPRLRTGTPPAVARRRLGR